MSCFGTVTQGWAFEIYIYIYIYVYIFISFKIRIITLASKCVNFCQKISYFNYDYWNWMVLLCRIVGYLFSFEQDCILIILRTFDCKEWFDILPYLFIVNFQLLYGDMMYQYQIIKPVNGCEYFINKTAFVWLQFYFPSLTSVHINVCNVRDTIFTHFQTLSAWGCDTLMKSPCRG